MPPRPNTADWCRGWCPPMNSCAKPRPSRPRSLRCRCRRPGWPKRRSTGRSNRRCRRGFCTNADSSTPRSPPTTRARAWPRLSRNAPQTSLTAEDEGMTDTAATSPADEAPEEEAIEPTPEAEKPAEEPAEKANEEPAHARDWWDRHSTYTGSAAGLVFLWLSMTPSLLPRGPLFQGLVSGAAGAIGYGIGVVAVWLGGVVVVHG